MLSGCSTAELLTLSQLTEATLRDLDLLQAKRRERGAWVRPGLAEPVQRLEQALLKSYWGVARELVDSLRGRADDIVSGRIGQARTETVSDAEVEAAGEFFSLDSAALGERLDRNRLPALELLLAYWLLRHRGIAGDTGGELFDRGRDQAVRQAGREVVPAGPVTSDLRRSLLDRYSSDIDRLRNGLWSGTPRSYGIEWIVGNSATVGEAAAHLRKLFAAEAYRIEMLAESLVWSSFQDGMRAGVVEAAREILRENGVLLTDDLSLEDVPEELIDLLPRYRWTGPDDEATCDPCRQKFGEPVVVLSLADLPAPETVCRFALGCRHHWEPINL